MAYRDASVQDLELHIYDLKFEMQRQIHVALTLSNIIIIALCVYYLCHPFYFLAVFATGVGLCFYLHSTVRRLVNMMYYLDGIVTDRHRLEEEDYKGVLRTLLYNTENESRRFH